MEKSTLIGLFLGVVVIGGGALWLRSQQAESERERDQLERERLMLQQQALAAQMAAQQGVQPGQTGAGGYDVAVAAIGAGGSIVQGVLKLFD